MVWIDYLDWVTQKAPPSMRKDETEAELECKKLLSDVKCGREDTVITKNGKMETIVSLAAWAFDLRTCSFFLQLPRSSY